MPRTRIAFAAHDVGQTNDLLALQGTLDEYDVTFTWFATGPAQQILKQCEIAYDTDLPDGDWPFDCVVAGVSVPANADHEPIDYRLLCDAWGRDIPRIMMVDVPGMQRRCGGLPPMTHYLVATLACQRALDGVQAEHITVTGSTDARPPVGINGLVVNHLQTIRQAKQLEVIVTVAARNTMTDIEYGLVAAGRTGQVGVCVSLHPDPAKQPSLQEQSELYERVLKEYPQLHLLFGHQSDTDVPALAALNKVLMPYRDRVEYGVPGTTLDRVFGSNYAVTGYSRIGATAAHWGIPVAAVHTAEVADQQTIDCPGVKGNWLVKTGLVAQLPPLSDPHSLYDLEYPSYAAVGRAIRAFDAEQAAGLVLDAAEGKLD